MPVALSLTGGFIMAAISPTVMVTGMLELQRRGYGQDKSAPACPPASGGKGCRANPSIQTLGPILQCFKAFSSKAQRSCVWDAQRGACPAGPAIARDPSCPPAKSHADWHCGPGSVGGFSHEGGGWG